jgi:F1F0 ATPase subunit 2
VTTVLILLAFVAGFAAGGVFYGGLKWTVNRLAVSPHAGLLLVGSFALRAAVVLVVLAVVGYGNWQRMLSAALGLIVARYALMPLLNREVKEGDAS